MNAEREKEIRTHLDAIDKMGLSDDVIPTDCRDLLVEIDRLRVRIVELEKVLKEARDYYCIYPGQQIINDALDPPKEK